MKRTYAAKRLLEHGPLSMGEFTEITGWKSTQCRRTMRQLVETNVAVPVNPPHLRHATRLYALASLITTDGWPQSTENLQKPVTGDQGRPCHG